MRRIRAVIVDDEPAARASVRALVQAGSEVDLVGEFEQASEIEPAMAALCPDVVFLDVGLSGESGLEAFQRVPQQLRPVVVFVTASEAHAAQAFDLGAADYLLKPYSDDRFNAAIARVRARLGQPAAANDDALERRNEDSPGDRLAIRTGNSVRIVCLESVEWVEAAGDYVRLHTDSGAHVLRSTMSAIEHRFEGSGFVRAHRCTLVRVARVSEVRGLSNGEWEVVMHSGVRRRLSESGRAALGRALRVTL